MNPGAADISQLADSVSDRYADAARAAMNTLRLRTDKADCVLEDPRSGATRLKLHVWPGGYEQPHIPSVSGGVTNTLCGLRVVAYNAGDLRRAARGAWAADNANRCERCAKDIQSATDAMFAGKGMPGRFLGPWMEELAETGAYDPMPPRAREDLRTLVERNLRRMLQQAGTDPPAPARRSNEAKTAFAAVLGDGRGSRRENADVAADAYRAAFCRCAARLAHKNLARVLHGRSVREGEASLIGLAAAGRPLTVTRWAELIGVLLAPTPGALTPGEADSYEAAFMRRLRAELTTE